MLPRSQILRSPLHRSPLHHSPRGTRTRASSDRWLYALVQSGRLALVVLFLIYISLFHLQTEMGFSFISVHADNEEIRLRAPNHPSKDNNSEQFVQKDNYQSNSVASTNVGDTEITGKESLSRKRPANDRSLGNAVKTDSDPQLESAVSLLETYDPSRNPVLGHGFFTPDKQRPVITVRLFVGAKTDRLSNVSIPVESKFLLDGLGRSDFVAVTDISFFDGGGNVVANHHYDTLESQPSVWMVDFSSLEQDCHSLESIVKRATDNETSRELQRYLVLMEYTGSSEVVHCPRLEKLIPREQIRLVKRGIVHKRYWNSEREWVDLGELVRNEGNLMSGGPVLHLPFALPENFVTTMRAMSSRLKTDPAGTKRSKDVAHFWRNGDNSHYSFLRQKVSQLVQSLEKSKAGGRKIHTLVDVLDGSADDLQERYITALLSSKIVVVAQRDEWEDHHRLLESLSCGAMVIADTMLGLPKGLEDRKNIVMYNSTESLKEVLLYYLDPKHDVERLEIARNGFNVAMGQHRSWHRMEEILFGKPLTMVNKPFDAPPKNVL